MKLTSPTNGYRVHVQLEYADDHLLTRTLYTALDDPQWPDKLLALTYLESAIDHHLNGNYLEEVADCIAQTCSLDAAFVAQFIDPFVRGDQHDHLFCPVRSITVQKIDNGVLTEGFLTGEPVARFQQRRAPTPKR